MLRCQLELLMLPHDIVQQFTKPQLFFIILLRFQSPLAFADASRSGSDSLLC